MLSDSDFQILALVRLLLKSNYSWAYLKKYQVLRFRLQFCQVYISNKDTMSCHHGKTEENYFV